MPYVKLLAPLELRERVQERMRQGLARYRWALAIFTGKSPAQLHMTFINEGKNDSGANPNGRVITPSASMELPTSKTTLAEVLKCAG